MRFQRSVMVGLIPLLLLLAPAGRAQLPRSDLTTASLEDLMNFEITSVSKKAQRVSDTAAAVFVITGDDIAQSGAANIPDLLRMVPGLNVEQISASVWAISARGMNDRFTDKLLVLLDGRSVYTPTFSGVYWDGLDLPLEDIERIEVVRGPGGSAWGANAVNGIINIITKKASETQGGMAVAGAGNLQQGFGTVQLGKRAGRHTAYRVFTKYFNQTHLAGLRSDDGADDWNVFRGGFRVDTTLSEANQLTLTGDAYTGREGQTIPVFGSFGSPTLQFLIVSPPLSGGYLQGRFEHQSPNGADSALQISYDGYHRSGLLDETRKTLNIDFQDHRPWRSRHDLVWGVGFRNSVLDSAGPLALSVDPASQTTNLFSSFLQDEIKLVENHLSFTAGVRVERSPFSGWGWMPGGRLAWKLSDRAMAWAAIARALRTPAAFDTGIRANFGGYIDSDGTPIAFRLLGNPNAKAERLVAYEAGYRTKLSDSVSLDVALYYNDYRGLTTVEPLLPFLEVEPSPPHVVAPFVVQNLMHGETHGLEVFGLWRATSRWTIAPAFAFEQIHMHSDPGSQDLGSIASREDSTPHRWARLESRLKLSRNWSWTLTSTYRDRLPARTAPGCTRLDSQINWRVREDLSFSVVGENLLQDRHLEFVDTWQAIGSSLVRRSIFGKLTWTF